MFEGLGLSKIIILKEINTFTQQGCIQLIKRESNNFKKCCSF